MCSEVTSHEGDEAQKAGWTAVEEKLSSMYRKYIGEPESQRDVYVGFGMFFGGITLGLVGLALFLYSGLQPTGSVVFWQYREIALVFTMMALPVVVLSVSALLPVGRQTMATGIVGMTVCVIATAWLVTVYPYGWEGTGNDIRVVSTYAAGLVFLAASTGSALVGQYVDRLNPPETESAADTDDGQAVSDEEVAEDIDEAMSETNLTWGAVEERPNAKRLTLDIPDADTDIDKLSLPPANETRSRHDNVDDAVSGLQQLKGGDQKTSRVDSPDNQVDALTEFRRQQEANDELVTGVETDRGVLARLREKLLAMLSR